LSHSKTEDPEKNAKWDASNAAQSIVSRTPEGFANVPELFRGSSKEKKKRRGRSRNLGDGKLSARILA